MRDRCRGADLAGVVSLQPTTGSRRAPRIPQPGKAGVFSLQPTTDCRCASWNPPTGEVGVFSLQPTTDGRRASWNPPTGRLGSFHSSLQRTADAPPGIPDREVWDHSRHCLRAGIRLVKYLNRKIGPVRCRLNLAYKRTTDAGPGIPNRQGWGSFIPAYTDGRNTHPGRRRRASLCRLE
jgi:hypothetical protein